MKLDVSNLRYLTRDDFKVLAAVEIGMRNHALVPTALVCSIAAVKGGGAHKNLQTLLRCRLVHHDNRMYDGYRLTYPGYDFLALKTLMKRGFITGVGRQIGVGKESDIFLVYNENTGEQMALKLQRLGRVSFRSIKKKRDYLQHRKSASWLYMSFLGARKEFAFMSALKDAGFDVPIPIAHNRHAVLMSLVPGKTLANTRPAAVTDPSTLWNSSLNFVLKLADHGLIHCDLNEFNIMFDPELNIVTLIDFPQMVSTSHPNAAELFERDVACLLVYFKRRHEFIPPDGAPSFASLSPKSISLDVLVEASGFFTKKQAEDFNALWIDREKGEEVDDDEDEEEDDKDVEEGGGGGGGGGGLPLIVEEDGIDRRYEESGEQERDKHSYSQKSTSIFSTTSRGDGGNKKDGEEEDKERDDFKIDEKEFFNVIERESTSTLPILSTFVTISKEVLGGGEGEEEDDDDNDGEDLFKNLKDDDDDNDDDDDEEEEDEEETEEEAKNRRKKEALDEAALASFRPPLGVRTMPGGRRIKPRGGEAYLNPRSSKRSTDDDKEKDDDDERGSVISKSTRRSTTSSLGAASATIEDVRLRVKVKLHKAKEKKDKSDVIGRALSSNDNKDKQNKKIQNMATYDMSWDIE
jgi:RIO kinase 2